MSKVVHPYAHRLVIIRDWKSRWFADKKYDLYRSLQTIKHGWRITTKQVVAGTTSEKFVAQIALVCDWIEKLYDGPVMSRVLQDAITEFREKHIVLQKLQDTDVPQFLIEIQKISFWKYCMETGLETLFRLVVCNRATGQKLLPSMYTRNAVVEPVDGEVGLAGRFDGLGSLLGAFDPRFDWSRLGLGFSCTEV